jgi:hypothetical protein
MLEWHYFYSPRYAVWHHILGSEIQKSSDVKLVTHVYPQEVFQQAYKDASKHFFSGITLKHDILLEWLEAHPGKHIIFSDVDLVVKDIHRLIEYVKTFLDYDIVYSKERTETDDTDANIGFGLIKSTPAVIELYKEANRRVLATGGHDQEIINQLHKDTSALIAIAHPLFMESFKPEDFKFLNNYDFIEVLNQFRFSIAHWDSALSTGHATFILADDDGHDLNNIYEIGRCLTFINAPLQKDSILYALKSGCAYGADVYMSNNETNEQKKNL